MFASQFDISQSSEITLYGWTGSNFHSIPIIPGKEYLEKSIF